MNKRLTNKNMQGDLHLSILTYLYESTSRNSHIYDIFSSFMRGFVIKNIDMLLDMKIKELNKMDFFIIHIDLLPFLPTQNATYSIPKYILQTGQTVHGY